MTYYPGMPNFERKSFSVATGSAEVTDEMWDAIFGEKDKNERKESQAAAEADKACDPRG